MKFLLSEWSLVKGLSRERGEDKSIRWGFNFRSDCNFAPCVTTSTLMILKILGKMLYLSDYGNSSSILKRKRLLICNLGRHLDRCLLWSWIIKHKNKICDKGPVSGHKISLFVFLHNSNKNSGSKQGVLQHDSASASASCTDLWLVKSSSWQQSLILTGLFSSRSASSDWNLYIRQSLQAFVCFSIRIFLFASYQILKTYFTFLFKPPLKQTTDNHQQTIPLLQIRNIIFDAYA